MDYGTDVVSSHARDPREVTLQAEEPAVHWIPLVSSSMKLSDQQANYDERDGRMREESLQTSRKIVGVFASL